MNLTNELIDKLLDKHVDEDIKLKKKPLALTQFKFKVGDKVEYFVVRNVKDGTFYRKTGKITKCFSHDGKPYYQLFPKPFMVSRFEESLLALVQN